MIRFGILVVAASLSIFSARADVPLNVSTTGIFSITGTSVWTYASGSSITFTGATINGFTNSGFLDVGTITINNGPGSFTGSINTTLITTFDFSVPNAPNQQFSKAITLTGSTSGTSDQLNLNFTNPASDVFDFGGVQYNVTFIGFPFSSQLNVSTNQTLTAQLYATVSSVEPVPEAGVVTQLSAFGLVGLVFALGRRRAARIA
jgi:hypothetical protein